MDRNFPPGPLSFLCGAVALRKESVDRNIRIPLEFDLPLQSLSARRAWIEIDEGVYSTVTRERSLSARRAWIEIYQAAYYFTSCPVALRKESVDRNASMAKYTGRHRRGRSPQGERG